MTRRSGAGPIAWPDGKRFAFTIFDDTDMTTLRNGPPVYDALTDLGLRVTKSVWTVAPHGPAQVGGGTCADADYRRWAEDLQDRGHEIGFHNATDHPSTRQQTIDALDRFRDIFGHDPRIGADHSGNREMMYWGSRRLSGIRARAYQAFSDIVRPNRPRAEGHVPDSPYFWGDICRARIDYWRNFTFNDLNLLRPCPQLPYHDPARPYVNWWFASTHAPHLGPLLDTLHPDHLDLLEAEGGVCILYTHMGVDAAPDGKLDPRFLPAFEEVARRDGWFAPVSEVLDHLRAQRATSLLDDRGRRSLENHWILDQTRSRGVSESRRVVSRIGPRSTAGGATHRSPPR